ncbi:MAG TPA: hypothetical protein VMY40_06860 [Anaerolineae bacterium]|nr:hypothetical protein [Anaerolineae bacterium]
MNKLTKGIHILWSRLTQQGLRVTALWAADHAVRIVTGAPIRRVSQITPHLHVGGQYRRRGWPRLAARGITAVVNVRVEFDDNDAGIAPPVTSTCRRSTTSRRRWSSCARAPPSSPRKSRGAAGSTSTAKPASAARRR